MFIRFFLTITFLAACCLGASASGTPEEDAACRPDVRRFCGDVPKGADDNTYLACLENHRDRLSKKCLAVLTDHGR